MKEINAQSPISVANFIIELANKHNLPVTNLQLQKILFFVQGFSLAEYQSSLINGKFSNKKLYLSVNTLPDPLTSNGFTQEEQI